MHSHHCQRRDSVSTLKGRTVFVVVSQGSASVGSPLHVASGRLSTVDVGSDAGMEPGSCGFT